MAHARFAERAPSHLGQGAGEADILERLYGRHPNATTNRLRRPSEPSSRRSSRRRRRLRAEPGTRRSSALSEPQRLAAATPRRTDRSSWPRVLPAEIKSSGMAQASRRAGAGMGDDGAARHRPGTNAGSRPPSCAASPSTRRPALSPRHRHRPGTPERGETGWRQPRERTLASSTLICAARLPSDALCPGCAVVDQ